jgi:hypothetical protein
MSRGKRFESARRLSFLPANSAKTKSLRSSCRTLCQQYVSSRLLSQSLVPLALACYKWLQGTAGGVGKPSGVDRLTDVPRVSAGAALYRAFGERFPVSPLRVRVVPEDIEGFVTRVYVTLGGLEST